MNQLVTDSETRAKSAGLNYVTSFEVGWSRQKCGKGFKFLDENGNLITDREGRKRLMGLVIPPAWKDVWIAADPLAHIQVTGMDEAGRKQYIYHSHWSAVSSAHKYSKMIEFARVLPAIRKDVINQLRTPGLSKRKVVAAVVRLLDKSGLRVGNKQYLEANESRGATTLSSENVDCDAHSITFTFKGKSGRQIEVTCNDDLLASVVAQCEKVDSEFLFSYKTAEGEYAPVTSADINSYLMEFSKTTVTAKDFRTWRGSVTALAAMKNIQVEMSETARKRFIAGVVRVTSQALCNTPAVCRSSYIHTSIISLAQENRLSSVMSKISQIDSRKAYLSKDERMLISFLSHIEREQIDFIPDTRTARAA